MKTNTEITNLSDSLSSPGLYAGLWLQNNGISCEAHGKMLTAAGAGYSLK